MGKHASDRDLRIIGLDREIVEHEEICQDQRLGSLLLASTSHEHREPPTAVRQHDRYAHAGLEVADFVLGDGLSEIAGNLLNPPLIDGQPPLLDG